MSDRAAVIDRVVLWGLMASGKSAVGRELARRLGWELVDLDREIERREGRTVAEIFAADGEPFFRELELRATRELIGRPRIVFSCGGGWVTNPEAPRLVPPGSLTVWLQVSPERALERVRGETGGAVRPLLSTPDPGATIRRLLEEREPLYRRAELVLSTDARDARAIATDIEARVRHPALAPSECHSLKGHAEG